MKVLLIDDEPIILQGLAILIDWKKEGFEIAKLCNGANEALEYLANNEVDLIISDIKMPYITGIELAKKLMDEKISDALFVILSGYDDFNFAKDAIRCKCFDYVLKPIQVEELLKVLKEARKYIEINKTGQNTLEIKDNKSVTRNLIALLKGKYDEVDLDEVKEYWQLDLKYRYVEIELNEIIITEDLSNVEKRQIQRKIYKHCMEFLGDEYKKGCLFDVSGVEKRFDVGIIFKVDGELDELKYFKKLKEYLNKKISNQVVILIGKSVSNLEEISSSYNSVVWSLMVQNFDKNQDIIYFNDNVEKKENEMLLSKKSIDKLVCAIDKNSEEDIINCVENLYKNFVDLKESPDVIKLNINYLLFELVNIAVVNNENINREEIIEFYNSNAFELGTKWGSKKHLIKFGIEYGNYLMESRKTVSNPVIYEIEKDIKQRYAENITLKEFSQKYFINKAYLGQLFKKTYGISFKDYLNDCRMNEAINLLMRTNLKVYEIADKVGYKDVDYFISRFIIKTGCTPTKYRKINLKN